MSPSLYSYFTLMAVGIIVGMWRWKKLPDSLKLLWALLLWAAVTEAVGQLIAAEFKKNTIVYSLLRPVAFGLLAYVYYLELGSKTLLYAIPVFLCLHLLNGFFLQPFGQVYDSYSMIISMLASSVWALLYLRRLLLFPEERHLRVYALFWASCGYLLFNASSLFVFGTLNIVRDARFSSAYPVLQTMRLAAAHILYLTFLLSFLGRKVSLPTKNVTP